MRRKGGKKKTQAKVSFGNAEIQEFKRQKPVEYNSETKSYKEVPLQDMKPHKYRSKSNVEVNVNNQQNLQALLKIEKRIANALDQIATAQNDLYGSNPEQIKSEVKEFQKLAKTHKTNIKQIATTVQKLETKLYLPLWFNKILIKILPIIYNKETIKSLDKLDQLNKSESRLFALNSKFGDKYNELVDRKSELRQVLTKHERLNTGKQEKNLKSAKVTLCIEMTI